MNTEKLRNRYDQLFSETFDAIMEHGSPEFGIEFDSEDMPILRVLNDQETLFIQSIDPDGDITTYPYESQENVKDLSLHFLLNLLQELEYSKQTPTT